MLSVTNLSQKESFPGSEFKPASIWTCWMQIDRQMQSAPFMPELHRWIRSWLPATCSLSTRRSFDHHGKGNGNFVKRRVSNNEKKSYLSLIWKRWKSEMTARLPVTVSSVQTWFYMLAYVKKFSPGSTQLPTSWHLLSPPPPHSDLDDTHTHTHTHIHTYTY